MCVVNRVLLCVSACAGSYKNDRPADHTLGRGKAAGGGAVSGKAVFTPQQAVECWKQQEACIFVHPHTSRDHLDGLKVQYI